MCEVSWYHLTLTSPPLPGTSNRAGAESPETLRPTYSITHTTAQGGSTRCGPPFKGALSGLNMDGNSATCHTRTAPRTTCPVKYAVVEGQVLCVCRPDSVKFVKDNRKSGSLGLGRGHEGLLVTGDRLLLLHDENVLERMLMTTVRWEWT